MIPDPDIIYLYDLTELIIINTNTNFDPVKERWKTGNGANHLFNASTSSS